MGPYPESRVGRLLIVVAVLVAPVLFQEAQAATYAVNADGSGDAVTIQDAIDQAVDGDIIILGNGVFQGQGNRDLRFHGKSLTVRSIDDDPLQCSIDCGGQADEPHRAFVFNLPAESNSVLQGLTIRNGYALMLAGAVMCSGGASPLIKNCVFRDNHCEEFGGAILCSGYSSPRIEHCTFIDNVTGIEGGAVYCNRSSPTLISCIFTSNSGPIGGGLNCYRYCAATLIDCTFENNSATYGGGMFSFDSAPTLTGCRFVENHCLGDGGGFVGLDSSPSFDSCEFFSNTALEHGGGVYTGGAGTASLTSTTLADNFSPRGGALYSQHGTVDLVGCTLAGNEARESGSGIHLFNTSATLTGVIIAFGLSSPAVHCENFETPPAFLCSDIFGNMHGDWTGCIADQAGQDGNLASDPLFCDLAGLDLTLHSDSPCAAENHPDCGLIGSLPIDCSGTTGVNTSVASRPLLSISQNQPNPFNPSTTIEYELTASAMVCLRIFDMTGRLIRELNDWQMKAAGRHEAVWSGRDESGRSVAAGVYFYKAQTPSASATGRMTLLK